MVQPVQGSPPIGPVGSGDGSSFSPNQVFNNINNLWCCFQNSYDATAPDVCANNPTFFYTFSSAVNAFINYYNNNNGSTNFDFLTQQIYANLTNTNLGLGNVSIASICTTGGSAGWNDWNNLFGMIAPQLNVIYSNVEPGGEIRIPKGQPNAGTYDDWFTQEYRQSFPNNPPPQKPSSTPPSNLENLYDQLIGSDRIPGLLTELEQDTPGSANYITDGNNVVQCIINICDVLTAAENANPPTLDSYGQFLLSMFQVPNENGSTLESMATSIGNNGGFAGDSNGAQMLCSLLYSPNEGAESLASQLSGWVSTNVLTYEF